ncbi:MAG: HD domain-containing protein [Patescibacteria group bacterium]|nr:HD domain-containing protein [Patescibacteria group bacterium]
MEMPPLQESGLETMRRAAQELIDRAHEDINALYRQDTDKPLERREYHNIGHTKGVEKNAERILRTIQEADSSLGVTPRDVILARLIAAYHDIDQSQDKPNEVKENVEGEELTKSLRKRFIATIEKNSAGILLGRMQQMNEEQGELFTEHDKDIVKEAILATVPGFDRSLGTVTQPNLHEDASFITKAVALADLGAMMGGGEEFLEDGNRVFREDNIDIAEALEHPEMIDERKKRYFATRIQNWYRTQVSFVEGRQQIFEIQLLSFPESVRDKVKELFKFDEAIAAARQRIADIENATQAGRPYSFEQMMESMGYALPSAH